MGIGKGAWPTQETISGQALPQVWEVCAGLMEETTNYYELLGVGSDADAAEIKAAFKRMALKYHPDVYDGPDAEERMRLLLTAYKTLTNPGKRKTYDLANGISRRSSFDNEEPLTFYRAANGRGFTTSGRIPTPGKAAAAGAASSRWASEEASARKSASKVAIAFPRLDAGVGAVIALEGFVYTLTAAQAAKLREDGRLLGTDMPQRLASSDGTPAGRRCSCHRCGQSWVVPPDQRRSSTDRCPQCSAPDWSEYLLLRCQECTAVFESQHIRRYDSVKIGERYYGDFHLSSPYELFPTCPHCQAAHWCAGEEMRLSAQQPEGTRASGPLSQAAGQRPRVSGGIPRVSPLGHTSIYPAARPQTHARGGVPKMFLSFVLALLIAGVLFAIYAFATTLH